MREDEWMNSRYEKVFRHISEGVSKGLMPAGTRLPGERQLAHELGVSRETLRQGLRMAEEAGLVTRIATRGTFVAPAKVDQDLGVMDAFDSTVRQLNLQPAYRLSSVRTIEADQEQGRLLQGAAGEKLLCVRVLGQGSGLPLAVYESALPERVWNRLPADPPWGSRATYQVAAEALGLQALSVAQEFDAIAMPREKAQALRVRTNSPAFKVVSVFSSDGAPIELRTAWYPGSRYRFRVTRQIQLAK